MWPIQCNTQKHTESMIPLNDNLMDIIKINLDKIAWILVN